MWVIGVDKGGGLRLNHEIVQIEFLSGTSVTQIGETQLIARKRILL